MVYIYIYTRKNMSVFYVKRKDDIEVINLLLRDLKNAQIVEGKYDNCSKL